MAILTLVPLQKTLNNECEEAMPGIMVIIKIADPYMRASSRVTSEPSLHSVWIIIECMWSGLVCSKENNGNLPKKFEQIFQ